MPTPRPDRSVTWPAVEKPGAKIRSMTSSSDMAVEGGLRGHVALARDLADPRDVDAAAVILDLDHHVLALPRGPQIDRRRGGLAELRPFGRVSPARDPGRCAGHGAGARRSPRRSSCRPRSWRPRSSAAPACRAKWPFPGRGGGSAGRRDASGSTRRLNTERCSSPTRRSSSRCWFFSATASARGSPRPARARPNGRWRSWRSAARRSAGRGYRSDRRRHAA